jgi:hypothetical protein
MAVVFIKTVETKEGGLTWKLAKELNSLREDKEDEGSEED